MNDIIIGVTVGTPTSPAKIADEIKPVKTVNGVEPDEKGNVEVEVGANIITANSKDELPDPTTVPKGTIALVTSEG